MDSPLVLAREDPRTGDAARLIARLDSELARRYPESSIHGFDPESIGDGRGAFLVARDTGCAVGCGAVRLLGPGTAEIKRIFVAEEARGRGVAKALLRALEDEARRLSAGRLLLETGSRQPEALALFESEGYRRVAAFGEYIGDPLSVCLEKGLAPGGPK